MKAYEHVRTGLRSVFLTLGLFCMIGLLCLTGPEKLTAYGAEDTASAGSFYLTASISSRTLIEPVAVSYTEGQSIRDALKNSGYAFGNIDQFYITDIQGVAGNFNIYYDGGGYDLDEPASTITGMIFSERMDLSAADFALMLDMAAFLEREDNVQKYPAAMQAYTQGMQLLRQSGGDAVAAKTTLQAAIKEYEDLFKGPKYQIAVQAKQGSKSLSAPVIKLKDAYGNIYQEMGSSISVIAGLYTFVITDGGINSVEGTLTVSDKATLQVTLPDGAWITDLKLLNRSKASTISTTDADFKEKIAAAAVASEVTLDQGTGVFYVPDYAEGNFCLLYGEQGAVPDEDDTKLYINFHNRNTDTQVTSNISWETKAGSVPYLVTPDAEGADFQVWAQYTGSDGYVQKQTINCRVDRTPTLSALVIEAEGTRLPLEYDPEVKTYQLSTVSDSVDITAVGFMEGYQITGTGHLSVNADSTETLMPITVTNAAGIANTYTLKVTKKDSVPVTINVPSGCTLRVYNNADAEIEPVSGTYNLIPGGKYYYICTKQTQYHVKEAFVATDGLHLSAKNPEVLDVLTGLAFYNSSNAKSRKSYVPDVSFTPGVHAYTYGLLDSDSMAYAQATVATGYSAVLTYASQQSTAYLQPKSVTLDKPVSDTGSATACSYLLAAGGYTQNGQIMVSKTEDQATYYQTYGVVFTKSLQLSAMTVADSYGSLTYYDETGATISFNRAVKSYQVMVDRNTEAVTLDATFYKTAGYYAMVAGQRYEALEALQISLSPEQDEETVTLQICHEDGAATASVYTILVKKTDPVPVTFKITPAEAQVYLVNQQNGRHIKAENGAYPMVPGATYSYYVTCNGYVGQANEAYVAPTAATTITVNLTKAPAGNVDPEGEAQWPSFRADNYNNGVISAKTPVTAEDATLYWASSLGESYAANACGCPILANGYLYCYSASTIYKVDTVSGEVVTSGTMDHSSSFAINTPTYAEGMIFVGLANGTVQAFDADTLESLWIYRDPLKGQPNCPIVYHDGYIYTGFWLGEMLPANYVCLSVTDEDPANTLEEKLPTWRYTDKGFYWAGAYVCDNYVLVGTDDGESGYLYGHATILSLNPLTGDVISKVDLPETGDQRSAITFVPDREGSNSGYGYFTTKGGYFYRIRVEEDGTISEGGLKSLKLSNYSNDDTKPAMSSSTPTIYGNRAYIGVCGTAQFTQYSGHNITVIDLKHWDIAYSVPTQGYPQTSGLLTTAYEAETESVYVYFFDNYTPGKLRVLKDKEGQTAPETTTTETVTNKDGSQSVYDTAELLFTPYGAQAQYAICSVIADENGTLYFKNDSSYMMALGSSIKRLKITQLPAKRDYTAGEVFDGTGMQVTAVYSNGTTKDVTRYVTWSGEPLTADDTEFTIEFPYTMYHNEGGEAGVEVEHPFATVNLNIESQKEGEPAFVWAADGSSCKAMISASWSQSGTEETYDCQVTVTCTKEASCTEDGNNQVTATFDYAGQSYKKTRNFAIAALGHDLQEVEGKAADCKTSGWEPYQTCKRCDYSTFKSIPAKAHSWDEGTVKTPATTSAEGVMVYTCTSCKETREEAIPIEIHDHKVTEVFLIPATWTDDGVTAGTRCSICNALLSGCEVIPAAGKPALATKTYTYSGSAKKPTVKLGNLVNGVDYKVSYSNYTNVGTATAKVTLMGNYAGDVIKLSYTINPPTTYVKTLTAVSKGFTATWLKKTKQVTGYQLRYSIYSSMKSAKTVTITSYKTSSKKVTKLKAKKKYYVQIRTYKTVSGKKYYSSWSKYKTVKTK